jgi:hypothetical protein
MFSARMTVDTVIDVAVAGSMIITGVVFTDNMVYDTPAGDLILLVEKKLKAMGLSKAESAAVSHSSAMPLSLQVSAVHYLDALGSIPGRRTVAVALANLLTEYQARFAVTSLHMLVEWSQSNSPIIAIAAPGPIVGHDQNGTTVMPAPVDFLSWSPRIAGFATDPSLVGVPNRVLWTAGQMTPLAHQQLVANGWKVRQGAQP